MPRSKNSQAMMKAQKHPEILDAIESDPKVPKLSDLTAMGPDQAEQIAIAMAFQEVMRQISSHTASPSTLNQLIKSGSKRDREEMKKLINENALTTAKIAQIENESQAESDSKAAIDAMRKYSPSTDK